MYRSLDQSERDLSHLDSPVGDKWRRNPLNNSAFHRTGRVMHQFPPREGGPLITGAVPTPMAQDMSTMSHASSATHRSFSKGSPNSSRLGEGRASAGASGGSVFKTPPREGQLRCWHIAALLMIILALVAVGFQSVPSSSLDAASKIYSNKKHFGEAESTSTQTTATETDHEEVVTQDATLSEEEKVRAALRDQPECGHPKDRCVAEEESLSEEDKARAQRAAEEELRLALEEEARRYAAMQAEKERIAQEEAAAEAAEAEAAAAAATAVSDVSNDDDEDEDDDEGEMDGGSGSYDEGDIADPLGGEALVGIRDEPEASVEGGGSVCDGDNALIKVRIYGTTPIRASLLRDGEPFDAPELYAIRDKTKRTVIDQVFEVKTSEPGVYTLSPDYRDRTCLGKVTGSASVEKFARANAYVTKSRMCCCDSNVTLQLSGSPPWQVRYTDGQDERTLVFQESPGVIPVTGPGSLTVLQVQDASHAACGVTSLNHEVTVMPIPSVRLQQVEPSSDEKEAEERENSVVTSNICPGEASKFRFQFDGTAPWRVQIVRSSQNSNEDRSSSDGSGYTTTLASREQFLEWTTMEPGVYKIEDVVDSSGCPGIVEESRTAVVVELERPSAHLDAATRYIARGESETVNITLTGVAPWRVAVINGAGSEPKVFEGISDPQLSVDIAEEGEVRVVSVEDANCVGAVTGGAVRVKVVDRPSAKIDSDREVLTFCGATRGEVPLLLYGSAPWSIEYTADGRLHTETSIWQSHYILKPPAGVESITLNAISDDKFKDLLIIDTHPTIQLHYAKSPSAKLSGEVLVCPGSASEKQKALHLELEGVAPFKVRFTKQVGTGPRSEVDVKSVSETGEWRSGRNVLEVSEPGSYRVMSVEDAHCSSEDVTGEARIVQADPVSVQLAAGGPWCEDDDGQVTIFSMQGRGPFDITYTFTPAGEGQSATKDTVRAHHQAALHVPFPGAGTFAIEEVRGAECASSNRVAVDIPVSPLPTAKFADSVGDEVCPGSDVSVELTGEAPWTLTYSDGTKEHVVKDIQQSPVTLKARAGKKLHLVSIHDKVCRRNYDESLDENVRSVSVARRPSAEFIGAACPAPFLPVNDAAHLAVKVTGRAPVKVTINDEVYIVNDTSVPLMVAPGAKKYEMQAVEDSSQCQGTVKTPHAKQFRGPTGRIRGGGMLCHRCPPGLANRAPLEFHLTGEAPWSLIYTDGTHSRELKNLELPKKTVYVTEAGNYTLLAIADANCKYHA